MDNSERVRILEEEINKYIDKISKVPLYPIDRYRLVYFGLRYLDILGYKYDINSKYRLVVVNYYHNPDIESESIENLYDELSKTVKDMAIYDIDRQNILFQFREMIFKIDIKATYSLDNDNLKIETQQ